MEANQHVELEEGWHFLAAGLAKIKRAIDGDGEAISTQEYINLYTTVYYMCTQKALHDYSHQLYQRYKEDVDNYIKSTVLPSLREMHGDNLLRELVHKWRKYNLISTSQKKIFHYLDRDFIQRRALVPLLQVFNELQRKVTQNVIGMIDDEREGQLIDRHLLKNVLDVYVQISSCKWDIYKVDFIQAFCNGTKKYYAKKAQTWIQEFSDADYMVKVEECLQNEKERVAHYLCSSTEPKLMEAVRSVLITRHAERSLKNADSEGGAN